MQEPTVQASVIHLLSNVNFQSALGAKLFNEWSQQLMNITTIPTIRHTICAALSTANVTITQSKELDNLLKDAYFQWDNQELHELAKESLLQSPTVLADVINLLLNNIQDIFQPIDQAIMNIRYLHELLVDGPVFEPIVLDKIISVLSHQFESCAYQPRIRIELFKGLQTLSSQLEYKIQLSLTLLAGKLNEDVISAGLQTLIALGQAIDRRILDSFKAKVHIALKGLFTEKNNDLQRVLNPYIHLHLQAIGVWQCPIDSPVLEYLEFGLTASLTSGAIDEQLAQQLADLVIDDPDFSVEIDESQNMFQEKQYLEYRGHLVQGLGYLVNNMPTYFPQLLVERLLHSMCQVLLDSASSVSICLILLESLQKILPASYQYYIKNSNSNKLFEICDTALRENLSYPNITVRNKVYQIFLQQGWHEKFNLVLIQVKALTSEDAVLCIQAMSWIENLLSSQNKEIVKFLKSLKFKSKVLQGHLLDFLSDDRDNFRIQSYQLLQLYYPDELYSSTSIQSHLKNLESPHNNIRTLAFEILNKMKAAPEYVRQALMAWQAPDSNQSRLQFYSS